MKLLTDTYHKIRYECSYATKFAILRVDYIFHRIKQKQKNKIKYTQDSALLFIRTLQV